MVYMMKRSIFIAQALFSIICIDLKYLRLTFKNPFGNSQNISDLIKLNISGNYNEAHLETTKMNNPLAYDLLTKML